MKLSEDAASEDLPWKQLVAKAVHDLRTPLSSMRVTLEVLKLSSSDPGKLPMLIDTLGRQSDEMAKLLQALSENPESFIKNSPSTVGVEE